MEADVFLFDKSSQKHRYYVGALDRLLREMHGIDNFFLGKDVFMADDYGQCLPIVEKQAR